MSEAVEFWFDVVCPYAYLASTRIEALAAEAGVEVRWRPVLLGGIQNDIGATFEPSEAKARLTRVDIRRRAAWLDEPVAIPEAHPRRTVDAMRLLVAVDPPRVPELAGVLFRAYWVDGLDVADRTVLQRLVTPFELDVEATCADPEVRERLFAVTGEAVERGVFGVPMFVVGERRIWGVDRLHFVRQALGLPAERPPHPGHRGGRIQWFHDFSSPFSYLASTQVDRLARDAGAEVAPTPILLGGLFQMLGTPMVPLHSFSEARQRWQRRDMEDWAAWWGVPFRFPSTFPLRTVTPLRVALVEPGTTDVIYRAAWAEDRDIGDPDVLRGVLEDAGFDGATLLDATGDPAIKARLRETTDRAATLGVCGVPSFLVDGEHLFWGQDRLDQVARALSGWTVA